MKTLVRIPGQPPLEGVASGALVLVEIAGSFRLAEFYPHSEMWRTAGLENSVIWPTSDKHWKPVAYYWIRGGPTMPNLRDEVSGFLAWCDAFVGEVKDNNGTPMAMEWGEQLGLLRGALEPKDG